MPYPDLTGAGSINSACSCLVAVKSIRELHQYLSTYLDGPLRRLGFTIANITLSHGSAGQPRLQITDVCIKYSGPYGLVGGAAHGRVQTCKNRPARSLDTTSGPHIRGYFQFWNQLTNWAMNQGMLDKAGLASLMGKVFPQYASADDLQYNQKMLAEVLASFEESASRSGSYIPTALHSLLVSHGSTSSLVTTVPELSGLRDQAPGLGGVGSSDTLFAGLLPILDYIACLALVLPHSPLEKVTIQDHRNIDATPNLRSLLCDYLGRVINYLRGAATDAAVLWAPLIVEEWLQRRCPNHYCAILKASPGSTYSVGKAHALNKSSRPPFPGIVVRIGAHCTAPSPNDCSNAHALRVFIRGAKHRRHLKALNKLFPPTSVTDSRHQTTHLAELLWAYITGGAWAARLPSWTKAPNPHTGLPQSTPHQRCRAVNGVLAHIPVGTNQLACMGMVLAGLGIQHSDLVMDTYLKSGAMWRMPNRQQALLKSVGTYIRKCARGIDGQPITADAVGQLAYYDLLYGRSLQVSDWAAEMANRCNATIHIQRPHLDLEHDADGVRAVWKTDDDNTNPNLMRRDPTFYKSLRRELLDICAPLVTRRNTSEPLDRFYQRRHEWVASGSSAGANLKVSLTRGRLGKGEAIKSLDLKVSKRAWAEGTSLAQVRACLEESNPREVAHASEKYENGKARAIYGVEPMHYVINTYATKGFEERLHLIPGLEKGASGAQACALEQTRANITADTGVECSMLDYADFNRHHTPEAQSAIFEVFARLGERVGADADWIAANRWVANAKRNMYALFPGEKGEKKVLQGMFSGTRSTDLINTLLNLAYFRVANKWLEETVGITPKDLYHVHQGDDVWISNRNTTWARALYYCLNNMGFLFQPTKQMFGTGRGEYLRVLYTQGTARGYLARALSNYLLRPIQNANPMDPIAWARSISDSASLLVRRGMTTLMASAVYYDAIQFWARVRAHPKDHAPLSIPLEYYWTPSVQGGCSAPPPGCTFLPDMAHKLSTPMPQMRSSRQAGQLGVPTGMTDDWLDYVSKQTPRMGYLGNLDLTLNTAGLKESMVLANYGEDVSSLIPERGWATYKTDISKVLPELKAALDRCPNRLDKLVAHAGPDDAVAAAEAWLGYTPTQAKALGPYPYLRAHVDALDRGEVGFPVPAENLRDRLSAIITRSTFKSEATFARVARINRLEALSLILAQADELGRGDGELGALIAPLVATNNEAMLDLLLGGGGDLVPGLRGVMNSGFWQHMMSTWASIIFSVAACQLNQTPLGALVTEARGSTIWLQQCADSAHIARDIMY